MDPRLAAIKTLIPILDGKSSISKSLPLYLAQVGQDNKSLTQDLVFGTARWEPRLSGLINKILIKPLKKKSSTDVKALLLLGAYQLLYTRIPSHAAIGETLKCADKLGKEWVKGLLNAVLRKVDRDGFDILIKLEKEDSVVKTSHPEWLQRSLRYFWPKEWEELCDINNTHAPMTLRVNRRHFTRYEYQKELTRLNIESVICPISLEGLILESPCDVRKLPGFKEGWFSVQDGGAQIVCKLLDLKPGYRVIDLCSAPGGKSCHILESQIELQDFIAVDSDRKRLAKVHENIQRLGLHAKIIQSDGRNFSQSFPGELFDRVLLDVPCSATGVIRRHPDIKLTRKAEDIPNLASLQMELLESAWKLLKVDGILLYVTCSLLATENSEIITSFLKKTSNALEIKINSNIGIRQQHGLQLLPQRNSHDGFYYAKLIKTS